MIAFHSLAIVLYALWFWYVPGTGSIWCERPCDARPLLTVTAPMSRRHVLPHGCINSCSRSTQHGINVLPYKIYKIMTHILWRDLDNLLSNLGSSLTGQDIEW